MSYSARTQVFTIDPNNPQADLVDEAAKVLRAGRLVAFPTETVYGLGANALDPAAIERIYRAKQRPPGDPVIAHISTFHQINQLITTPPDVLERLAAAFWPGPLTLVLRRAPIVPANIAAGRDTIAVRMPAHPVARALLTAADLPIAAPSANTFTRPSSTTAAHVLEDLEGRVDIILDAGPTTIGLESTVLDLTGENPVVLRPGGITLEALRDHLPDVTLRPRFVGTDSDEISPGQMLKHYAPQARLLVFSGEGDEVLAMMQTEFTRQQESGAVVGVLASEEERASFPGAKLVIYGQRDDLAALGRQLFAALRELDALGVDVILVRASEQAGLGTAVWDRLMRAAEGKIIRV